LENPNSLTAIDAPTISETTSETPTVEVENDQNNTTTENNNPE